MYVEIEGRNQVLLRTDVRRRRMETGEGVRDARTDKLWGEVKQAANGQHTFPGVAEHGKAFNTVSAMG